MKSLRTIFRITRWVSVAALTLLCLAPSAVLGQGAKANFSGTWVLNVEKSNIAPRPSVNIQITSGSSGSSQTTEKKVTVFKNEHTLEVTQKADTIAMERIFDVNNRNMSHTAIYALNGKENKLGEGLNSDIATATFSADGKILTITTTRTSVDDNQETHQTKTTQVWRLTNPNTLSIVKSYKSTKETIDSFVYDRK